MKHLGLSLIIGTVLLVVSLFVPVKVTDQSAAGAVKLGWPLHYIIQDQSSLDPPYPTRSSFLSINEYPTEISWSYLVADFVFFVIVSQSIILLSLRKK